MTEQDARRQALRHLIELETSGHSEEAWARFEAWLVQDPAHREAFAKLERAWRTVGHLQEILQGRDLAPDRPSKSLSHASGDSQPPWRLRWRSISAVIILMVTGTVASYVYAIRSRASSFYDTGPAQVRVVRLAADSNVTLNRNTRIEVISTWHSREVRLDHGEAAFDVTSHWPRKFMVYAGQTELRDIGTRFDVLRVGDTHVEAVVERGAVVVSTATVAPSSAEHPAAVTEQTITAGQGVIVQSGQIVRQQVSAPELDRRLAWTKGMLVFDGTLAEAVAEFNRYNTRKLVVVDPKLLGLRVGGRYRTTDPDSFAKYLQVTHGITSKWIGSDSSGNDVILVGVHP